MEQEARCTTLAHSIAKGSSVTIFQPRSSLDSPFAPPIEVMLKVSTIMLRPFVLAAPAVGVEGLSEHHVNGKPLLLYISHLI